MRSILVVFVFILILSFSKAEEFNTPTSTILFCNLTQTCQQENVNISSLISDLILPGLRREFISNHTSLFLDLFYNLTLTPQEEQTWKRIQEKVESHLIPWMNRVLDDSNSVGVLASTSVSSISNINYNMEANILGPLRNELVGEFSRVTGTFDVTEREILNHLNIITQKVIETVDIEDGVVKQSIERVLNEIQKTIKLNSQEGYEKIHKTSIKISNSLFKEIEITTDKLIVLTENLHKDSEVLIEKKKIESFFLTEQVRKDINETTEEIQNEMNIMIQETQQKSIHLLISSMNRYELETELFSKKMKNALKKNGDVFMEIAISCVWIYLMFMISFEILPSKEDLKSLDYQRVLPMIVRRILQISPSSFLFPGLILLFEYKFENLNHVGLETKLYLVTLLIVQVIIFSSLFVIACFFQTTHLFIVWWKHEKPIEKLWNRLMNKIENVHLWKNVVDNEEGKFDYESNEHY